MDDPFSVSSTQVYTRKGMVMHGGGHFEVELSDLPVKYGFAAVSNEPSPDPMTNVAPQNPPKD